MAEVDAASPAKTTAPNELPEGDENADCTPVKSNSTAFKDINESKAELLARVQSLRKDLKEWRGKLDNQVLVYRQELGELRNTLNVEVEQLKIDFQDLRLSLKKQLDVTATLSDMIPSDISSPSPLKVELKVEEELPKTLNDTHEDVPLLSSASHSEYASP